jgi:monoamine oxidase
VGNCHFCGEHTSIDFQGYLTGAVETGKRVVGEILADLGNGPGSENALTLDLRERS